MSTMELFSAGGESPSRPVLDLEESDRALRRVGLDFAKHNRVVPVRYELGRLTVATDESNRRAIEGRVRTQNLLRDVDVIHWKSPAINAHLAQLEERHSHEKVVSEAQRKIIEALTETTIKGGSDVFCFPGNKRVEVVGLISNRPRHLAWIERDMYDSGVLGTLVPGMIRDHDPNKTQSGWYGVMHDGVRISARVRTYPRTLGTVEHGIVTSAMLNFRLHPDQRDLPTAAGLRLPQAAVARLRWVLEVKRLQGVITGLPGNGKSTSLYAILRELAVTQPNIFTLESPIEIFIDSLVQREVMSIKDAVEERRALLQCKPFAVWIGEALSAEDFGPLVDFLQAGVPTVLTYHERTALGALFRAKMIAGMRYVYKVGIVWAQQLVSPVCHKCSTHTAPSSDVLKLLTRIGVKAPARTRKRAEGSYATDSPCPECAGMHVIGPQIPLVETLEPDAYLRAALRHDQSWEPASLASKYFDEKNPSIAMQAAHLLVHGAIDETEFFAAASEEEIDGFALPESVES